MTALFSFSILYFFIALIGLVWASYTDLKERMVYDTLTYALLALGLGLHAIQSITEQSLNPIALSLGATVLAFVFSLLLWKLGVWAGGDVKLVTATASLQPLNDGILRDAVGLHGSLFQSVPLPLFFLTWFLFSVFAMLPYGMMLTLNALRERRELRKQVRKSVRENALLAVQAGAWIACVEVLLAQFQLQFWLALPLLIAVGLVPKKARWGLLLVAGIASAALNASAFAYAFAQSVVLLVVLGVLWTLFQTSRKSVLQREKKVAELKEGDIVGEWVVESDGIVRQWLAPDWKTIINHLKRNSWHSMMQSIVPKGTIIASPYAAGGLGESEVLQLNQFVREKKIRETILVKESAPFVPALLLGFLIASLLGDMFFQAVLA